MYVPCKVAFNCLMVMSACLRSWVLVTMTWKWKRAVHLVYGMLQVMKIGQVIRDEFDGKKDLSGIGGVESGRDAAEFLLLGANTVQVSILVPPS